MISRIKTPRLDLVRADRALLESDLNDHRRLARLLAAGVPAAWPPPLMDEGVIRDFIRICSDTTGPVFSTWYWIRDEPDAGPRVLIGCGGVLGTEAAADTVILGYSVLEEFRNQGYATEAIRQLVLHSFSLPGIRRILATTCPELPASIRVLEKNGFVKNARTLSGTGIEEGTLCYLLERA